MILKAFVALGFEARRADISVETRLQKYQAPSGATSSEYAAPNGAGDLFLDLILQRCRAYDAEGGIPSPSSSSAFLR